MIVYGHRTFRVAIPELLADFERRLERLPSAPDHDAIVDLLIDFGEAESAVADLLLADCDDERPELAAWRSAGDRLAQAFRASAAGDRRALGHALNAASRAVYALGREPQPAHALAKTPEGFACYALLPEQYIDAATRLAAALHPSSVLCVGLRSIGGVLAHVVAAALEARGVDADVRTLRPRGHPFDRRIDMTPDLARIMLSRADHVAIVDEGPGLSGSSFAAAVEAIERLGVTGERISLFPSWDAPAEALRSERARAEWRTHRRVVGAVNLRDQASAVLRTPADTLTDHSAARWRTPLLGCDSAGWPAAHPQHERVKFCDNDRRRTARFAGLGRYGRAKQRRAAALADAGFGPKPCGLSNGFIALEWLTGCPATQTGLFRNAPSLDRLAEYLGFIAENFATGQHDDIDQLEGMIRVNARESGLDLGGWLEPLPPRAAAPRVAIDGRLLPHEWVCTPRGPMKVDALDHHADDFFPGCRDIAWDVAGAVVELGLDGDAETALLERYRQRSRDTTIAARLPFYTAAYLAYRLGYATLAAHSLGSAPDGARFSKAVRRYRRLLAARAERPPAAPRY